ncbi:MAG: hypothetical protein U1F58_19480 [Burkholderiales bacterium]
MGALDDPMPDPARGAAAAGRAHSFTRRRLWHVVALVLALAVAWLVIRAYRQPDFIIDLANLLLC